MNPETEVIINDVGKELKKYLITKKRSTSISLFFIILISLALFGLILKVNYQLTPKASLTDKERVYFSDNIMEMLNKRYLNEGLEFSYCLSGVFNQNDESIFINKVDSSQIYEREINSVTSLCLEKSELHLHSHPAGTCDLSEEDKNALKLSIYSSYSCVICGEDSIFCLNKDLEEVEVII